MTLLKLVKHPDKRLRIKSEDVIHFDDDLRKLLKDMEETMYAKNGLGLAAVQIGVLQRILVMDVEQKKEENEGKRNPIFIINPVIIEKSVEFQTYKEGCLSFPGIYVDVKRPQWLKIAYYDENGVKKQLYQDGLGAVCISHELDHLNGITFLDHLSPLKRAVLTKKLQKYND